MSIAMLSVPWLLIPKPLFLFLAQKKERSQKKDENYIAIEDAEAVSDVNSNHGGHDNHEGGMGEIIIHQIIETIEYVLGTISHTASYLRIWALSLAHQQLSLVFFQKTLTMGLEMSFPFNGIALYFLFGAWFCITLGVLLC